MAKYHVRQWSIAAGDRNEKVTGSFEVDQHVETQDLKDGQGDKPSVDVGSNCSVWNTSVLERGQ